MARSFRIWEKKRGGRQTGSRILGSIGEALFFSALFLFASVSAIGLLTLQLIHSTPEHWYLTGWGLWLRILIIVSFLLVGGVGFIYTILQFGASRERRSAHAAKFDKSYGGTASVGAVANLPGVPSDANIINSPGVRLAYRLPIVEGTAWRFLLTTIICIVSSSAASVLLMLVWESLREGTVDWLAISFFIPAVAVSVASAIRFVKELTIHLTVGPTSIEISDHPLGPGNSYQICLVQVGQMSVSRLRLSLVCDEVATYREGTDVRTECSRVFEQPVLNMRNVEIRPREPLVKVVDLKIPSAAMHSFQSNSNSVRWKLLVTLKPRKWPVIERSFSIVIVPQNGKLE